MAIPFSRTTRSMNHDSFRPSLIAITIIALLLVVWMTWFFMGRLPIYATSTDFQVQEDGLLMVNFPVTSFESIRPGQKGEFIPTVAGAIKQPTVHIQIMDVPASSAEPVEVYLESANPLAAGQTGSIKVLVGQITPAEMLWRSIGK
jgi:hypothetical protein